MPLNIPKLAQDLLQLQTELSTMEDAEQAAQHNATEFARIMGEFVQSGDVVTAGTAAAQKGKVV